jgi:hypothetical protein
MAASLGTFRRILPEGVSRKRLRLSRASPMASKGLLSRLAIPLPPLSVSRCGSFD